MKNKNENFLKDQILINFFQVVSINLCKRDTTQFWVKPPYFFRKPVQKNSVKTWTATYKNKLLFDSAM